MANRRDNDKAKQKLNTILKKIKNDSDKDSIGKTFRCPKDLDEKIKKVVSMQRLRSDQEMIEIAVDHFVNLSPRERWDIITKFVNRDLPESDDDFVIDNANTEK